MDSIHILGGARLQGKVRIQGSKNAALPILAATLLTNDTTFLKDCPKIADVYQMVNILKSLGCQISWEKGGIRVKTEGFSCGQMPREAITGMRSSLCLLGALIGRCSEVAMEYPGGCVIGERPIDLHILALSQMGVKFREEEGRLRAYSAGLTGADITLPIPSVGATENILLAAVMAKGDTLISGAAREPEIQVLCEYLTACGAFIEGGGTDRIRIKGGRKLHGAQFTVPADRIVAGTYLFATVAAGGNVFLEAAPVGHMEAPLRVAREMGAVCTETDEGLYVQKLTRPGELPFLYTSPYPGFPTDLQSMVLAVRCIGKGKSLIEERIFEDRFRIVEPLKKMGADITVLNSHCISVQGVSQLHGESVEAKELRGGAALVLAGLAAEGETSISGCPYIYRGYENICRDLRELGARVVSV